MSLQVPGTTDRRQAPPSQQSMVNTTIMQTCVENKLPSVGLLQYAATYFNLNLLGGPTSIEVPSDMVKIKLWNLAHAHVQENGQLNFGLDFNLTTLNPKDMACLFRILHAYQAHEKTLTARPIFPVIVANLKDYFSFLCTKGQANDLLDALIAYNDPQLDTLIKTMRQQIQAANFQRLLAAYPSQSIVNPDAASCWATSLMQLVLHIPSLERALTNLPAYSSDRYAPLRAFIKNYRLAEEQGHKGICQTVNILEVIKALSNLSGGLLQVGVMQDTAEALPFVLNELKVGESICNSVIETTFSGGKIHLEQPMIQISAGNYGIKDGNGLIREYFFPRECGANNPVEPLDRKFSTPPKELLINLNRNFYFENPNPLIPPTQIKISNPVHMPMNLTLPSEYFVEGANKTYTCEFFIQHQGTVHGGHFVSYIKQLGQWWCYSDQFAWIITSEAAQKAFHTANIYYYKELV